MTKQNSYDIIKLKNESVKKGELVVDVLVMDDEAIIRNGLKKYLSNLNYGFTNILTAANAKEAFEIMKDYTPDLIFADIVMPGLDGLSFCKRVREKNRDIQFIIISGHSEMEYIKSAFKLSVADYIFKPVNFNELNESIEKAISLVNKTPKQKTLHKGYSKYTQGALEYIDENYYKPITVSSVADVLRITPNYLSSCFKQELGIGFNDYMTGYRMEKAADLLKDPLLKVNEISQIVGYDDQNYFARAFKKIHGLTPSEYRLKAGTGNG